MVKTYISHWLYTFPWTQVVTGYWQKYPNPYATHVLSEDVFHRTLTDDQVLISKRLLTKTNKLPRWGERLFARGSPAVALVLEESTCDLKQKMFKTVTRNINLKTLMTVEETCVYRPDATDPAKTSCEKSVVATSELFGFKTTLEAFAVQRYKKNQEKASLGLEFILQKLFVPHSSLSPILGIADIDNRNRSALFTEKAKTFFKSSSNDAL